MRLQVKSPERPSRKTREVPKSTPAVEQKSSDVRKLVDVQISFDLFWAVYSSKNKLSQNLKGPIIKHLKARGFWANQEWDAGIKDFGF